ncbi:glutaminase A [Bacillaceae bacterium]
MAKTMEERKENISGKMSENGPGHAKPESQRRHLEAVVAACRPYARQGEVVDYIPELRKGDPQMLGVSVAPCRGPLLAAGDWQAPFTLQSVSKVPALLLALEDHGAERVFSKVGMEPTGDPFHSIGRLELYTDKKPLNPMINAGAIAVASMIKGSGPEERFARILSFVRTMAQNPHITLNERVYRSEKETGDRNRSLAYFMKSTGIIETDVEEALDLYFRYNAIEVRCSDLARIGCFLANYGRLPGETKSLVAERNVRIALTIIFTSGMYNASGEFAVRVGIPAKSGVSGGILAVVPGRMGIGVIGPAIDPKGNSVAGVKVLERLAADWSLHIFHRL